MDNTDSCNIKCSIIRVHSDPFILITDCFEFKVLLKAALTWWATKVGFVLENAYYLFANVEHSKENGRGCDLPWGLLHCLQDCQPEVWSACCLCMECDPSFSWHRLMQLCSFLATQMMAISLRLTTVTTACIINKIVDFSGINVQYICVVTQENYKFFQKSLTLALNDTDVNFEKKTANESML